MLLSFFYSTSISFSGRYRKGVKVFLFSDSNFSVSNQGLGVWGKGPAAHKPFAEKRTDYPLGVKLLLFKDHAFFKTAFALFVRIIQAMRTIPLLKKNSFAFASPGRLGRFTHHALIFSMLSFGKQHTNHHLLSHKRGNKNAHAFHHRRFSVRIPAPALFAEAVYGNIRRLL